VARLAISKDYFAAYARLPRKAQRKADEFLGKFQQNSASAAIHLEPLQSTADRMLRSARIGDDYRLILRAPESGDVFLVLWADHHDEAYRWAKTKQTAVHPATGSLQIFDADLAARALTTQEPDGNVYPAPPPSDRVLPALDIFSELTDDELYLAGVPRPLLPSVRSVVSDDELDVLLPHLPPEAGEVLTGVAAGLTLDQAIEEVLGRIVPAAGAPEPPKVDVADVEAALERETTQRQFRLLDGSVDLDAALKHPLDVWRVFLHPRQRRIARSHTKGPTRVLGGAGTGKTVVAMHRVGFLVKEIFTKPDQRVLFTTFTANLAQDLRTQLGKLLEPDELARVEVKHIDRWAIDFLKTRGKTPRIAFDKDQAEHFRAAYEVYGPDEYSLDFCRTEWREVVQDQGLQTEQDYVLAIRKHRGVPLARAERRKIWPVLAAYREGLEQQGMVEPVDVLRRAKAELDASPGAPLYESVVVDETQDFSADALRLVRAIAGPERPDDLFLVGDAHQRIYGHPVSLTACGIQVRGRRSQTLRLNYRTTGSICRWSLQALTGIEVDDLDDGKADRRGYISLREGPAPMVQVFPNAKEEEAAVAKLVLGAIDRGLPAESICVVARTKHLLADRYGAALARAGLTTVTLEQEEPRLPGVRLATMHRVKGLEFGMVVIAGASKDHLPYPTAELSSGDPVVAAQAELKERSLLYVAASRARDELYVTASGTPSPFLTAMPPAKPSRPPGRRPSVSPPVPVPVLQSSERAEAPAEAAGLLDPAPLSKTKNARTGQVPSPESLPGTQLMDLDVPVRLVNWALSKGISTLEELSRCSPQEMLGERNLGRRSIAAARAAIEKHLGLLWEEHAKQGGKELALPPALTQEEATARGHWDALRATLTPAQCAVVLLEVPFSARVRGYIEKNNLQTVGDLASRSSLVLSSADNFGRKSVKDLAIALGGYFERAQGELDLAQTGLMEGLKSLIEREETMPRIIASRRSGLSGEPQTLQELGDTFGVSRERIRQLEGKFAQSARQRPWGRELRMRVEAALPGGAVLLSDLEHEPWWAGAEASWNVVRFAVETIVADEPRVILWDDDVWLSARALADVELAWSEYTAQAQEISLPAPSKPFEELTLTFRGRVGVRFAQRFHEKLRELLHLETRDGAEWVLGFGDSRRAEVLAILRKCDAPIHVDELRERMGRRALIPDEVMYFARGMIGLEQHFPDFAQWRERLVPAAKKVMEEQGPERQWSTSELVDELREDFDIPAWLTDWCLASLIRTGKQLAYLGRLRVALPSVNDGAARVQVVELLEKLVRDAGRPLQKGTLVENARTQIGVPEMTLLLSCNRLPFVRLADDEIGLFSRDIPGGPAAAQEAVDQVASVLIRKGRGVSLFHAHEEVMALSSVHEAWPSELTLSVLRTDGRFRLSRGGGIGLSEWESTRMPSRLELVRAALDDGSGRVSVEAATARIEAHYGDRPVRSVMNSFAHHLGARLDGEWILRKRAQ
jgi:superfamily I DNA/RNA helicase/mRNA-degrading endonuclease RelE of RelBE toxin-antitoxin system